MRTCPGCRLGHAVHFTTGRARREQPRMVFFSRASGNAVDSPLRLQAAAVLLGGLAFTAVVALVLAGAQAERDRNQFAAAARAAQDNIADRVEMSIALLRGAAGLFASHGAGVTVESFRAYMDRVALRRMYPGILGLGYTRRIHPIEREAVEREMREQGHDAFRVWPEAERGELHSIVFLEPLDERNRAAIGYDMYTHPVRREAMEAARDLGMASASGIVELVQEIDTHKQPGFLIYLPVYYGASIPPTVGERRERLAGYAYAPIRAGDFLSTAFSHESEPTLGLAVYYGRHADRANLLYEHGRDLLPARSRFTVRSTVDIAGQPWTFEFRSLTSAAGALAAPMFVALAGGVLSLLLAALLWREGRARVVVQSALEREQAARGQAERANRMKDQFFATLSHELRTPLSAIVGWAAVLRRGGLSDAETRAGIEVVDRNARTQARLIDDLLDMNRIISGKLGMNMQAVDPAAVLEDALAAVAPAAEAKGVALATGERAPKLAVRGDPARLQQVMWNLLSNAIKFTPPGGRVEAALERADRVARLRVVDTGEGIDPRFIDQVFDRFAQLDGSTRRRHGGLGLGLAIVKELVALHGGAVRAESGGTGRGATFVVELPLMPVHPETQAVEEHPGAEARLEGLKILVVDDEPDARDIVRVVLEQRRAMVRCAASAREALDMAGRFLPDVLVSDIGMPGMDGYDLIRRIRARVPEKGGNVPAVALTAYASEEDRAEALRAGYQAHLVKPAEPEELIAAIAAVAQRAPAKARAA